MMTTRSNSVSERIHPSRVFFRRRPERMPPALWRQFVEGDSREQRVLGISGVVVMLGTGVCAVCYLQRLVARYFVLFSDWTLVAAAIVLMASMFVYRMARRRICRQLVERLVEANACVCLECGYSLVGSVESDVCPECGDAFDLAMTRRIWLKWFPELAKRLAAETA